MNISCHVVLDLIPLVKDGVASDDSAIMVNEHIKSCPLCREEFNTFETIKLKQPSIKDERVIYAIKRSIFMAQMIILVVGAIVGVALTNSMDMFYNFIIMPLIGGISFIAIRRRSYLAVPMVFALSYVWQASTGIILGGLDWGALYSGLWYSTIYAFLVGLGLIIARLLKFAFKKER